MKEKEVDSPGGLSRRGFLKGAGLSVAATTLLGACRQGVREGLQQGVREGKSDVLRANRSHGIRLEINGARTAVKVQTGDTLLEVVRNRLDLTGAKPVCEMGSCGACTLIVNGWPVNSCIMLAVDADGAKVQTVEGLASGDWLHPVQEAFVQEDALQCGFCTPGMVVTCKALIDRNPTPSRNQVKEALSGNICRCGTYENIFRAMDRLSAANRRGN